MPTITWQRAATTGAMANTNAPNTNAPHTKDLGATITSPTAWDVEYDVTTGAYYGAFRDRSELRPLLEQNQLILLPIIPMSLGGAAEDINRVPVPPEAAGAQAEMVRRLRRGSGPITLECSLDYAEDHNDGGCPVPRALRYTLGEAGSWTIRCW